MYSVFLTTLYLYTTLYATGTLIYSVLLPLLPRLNPKERHSLQLVGAAANQCDQKTYLQTRTEKIYQHTSTRVNLAG